MKRLILILISCLLLFAYVPAAAEQNSARFLAPVFTAPYGKEATVSAKAAKSGAYELRTGDGLILGSASGGNGKSLRFHFMVTRDLSKQTIPKLFETDGEEALCEALLFCDEPQNGGIKRVDTSEKKLAITFDAAISDSNTRDILKLLEQYGAHCTFFVIGKFPESHPELCREMIEKGHELASHSYEHLEMKDASSSEAYESLYRTDQVIRRFNGDKPALYRPPSGVSTFRDRAIAHGLGSEVILWEVDSGDGFADKKPAEVLRRVKNNLHDGGIVLMHVYGGATLYTLQELLPYYTHHGYRFVTVSELLLKEESFVDGTGTQRKLRHDEKLFSKQFLDKFRKPAETFCHSGHTFVNGVCGTCGAMEPQKIQRNDSGIVEGLGSSGSLYRIHIHCLGQQLFTIREKDADGNQVLLATGWGEYRGSVPAYGTAPYSIEIEGYGSWSVKAEPIEITADQAFSGRGEVVTDLAELTAGPYRFTHDGNSNFIVRMLTTKGETVLLNLTGACDETVDLPALEGSYTAFSVMADGRWTIAPAEKQP